MIPASISAGIAALSASVTALGDLSTATRYDIGIVGASADSLASQISSALDSAAGDLDASDPTLYVGQLPDYLMGLASASTDQGDIAAVLGLVGRAAFNIAQA